MPQAFKVTGHTLVERIGYMPAVHTDYEIVVAFERWEDNRETVENFVEWYWSIDLKANPREGFRVLRNETCARALAVFHFREQNVRLHDQSVTYVATLPPEAPTEETATFRLWITKETKKDIFTPLNAGWELYCRCEYGKISVEDAKVFLRDKFPGQYFSWPEVLSAFSKQGGRYTDKYLRRD